VAPAQVPGRFTPNVAMLELAVTALELACRLVVVPAVDLRGLRCRDQSPRAAERLAVALSEIARRVALRHDIELPATS